MLGSYRFHDNARRAAKQFAVLDPRIVASTVDGRTLFRIVSDVSVGGAKAAGIADAWSMVVPNDQVASL